MRRRGNGGGLASPERGGVSGACAGDGGVLCGDGASPVGAIHESPADGGSPPCHCEEGEARRGNPRPPSPGQRIRIPAPTPVCALARNDRALLCAFRGADLGDPVGSDPLIAPPTCTRVRQAGGRGRPPLRSGQTHGRGQAPPLQSGRTFSSNSEFRIPCDGL